ncbi:UPF0182 family protein [Nocardioides sp. DS6]|uniref:UPF0182 family protein n=1 Tax=Nocardioides eburneus TaxID=3231482 RepID=A0ABV3T0L6_9ACTN
MSELFDDDPHDAPPRRPSTRARWLVISGVVLVLFFFALTTFASLYTDGLWYHSVDFDSVFGTLFWTRTILFVVFGLLMAAAIAVPVWLAYRARPFFHPADDHGGLERYRDAITPIRTWLLVGVAGISGIFAGVSGAGRWRTYLLWRNGVPFGSKDRFFHRDVGFYVFDLPWWHYLVNFALTALILATLASLVVHYVYGGIRLGGAVRDRISRPAGAQISVLVGLVLALKAVDYWLDRFDLVHDSGPVLDGIGYTDDHAVLPGKNILIGISVICALLFFANVWRRSWQLPSVGIGLLLVSAIVLGLIWPAIVQAFQVKPSQSDKERTYLAANIAATRAAYGIDDVETVAYKPTADASATSAKALDNAASSVPVADPVWVRDEFEQIQQGRSYYTVAPELDVDRYDIDGHDRALVLGVRELKQSGISTSDRTWTNLHTVYTHSNGVVAAYANQRGRADATEHADTQWAEGRDDSDLTAGQKNVQDQVYFGEDSPDYSIVGRPAGAKSVELDYGSNEGQQTTTYAGKGGVPIGSTFRRLMYAIQYGSANFLLSERVNDDSKVLDNRTPQQRVEKVAPWLTLDDDAYPVVEDGRILWVVDGYTTTDRYPQSASDSFAAMTNDARPTTSGTQTVPTDEINYMRNAVKATVDAYDGTVHLYAWDDSDPILKTWEKAFPGVVEKKADIPAALLPHLRYPEDLYKVQRYQLAKYHVTDAVDFLNANDQWSVPDDPNNPNHQQTPARMFLPGASGDSTWSITSAFTPLSRQNLAAVMTVDSDATDPKNYGKIRVLTGFGQGTAGPGMISNTFRTDSRIADAIARFSRSASSAAWGQVLTVPTASHGLLYVEPVYASPLSGSGSNYQRLAYVLVSYDGRVGYGRTLGAALSNALGGGTAGQGGQQSGNGGQGTGRSSGQGSGTGQTQGDHDTQVRSLLAQAQQLFDRADAAGRSNDFALREKLMQQAEAKVDQALELLNK